MDATRRPPSVTTACVFLGISCLLLALSLADTLSTWGSIELQDQLRPALEDGPLQDAGVSMEQLLQALRWVVLGFVGASVAGIIFAIYTVRGHRSSRVALTVVAVGAALMFVALGPLGLIPAAVAMACAFSLWSPDARRWFAVKNGATSEASATTSGVAASGADASRPDPTHPDPTHPDPTHPDPTHPDPTPPDPFEHGVPASRASSGVEPTPTSPPPPGPPDRRASGWDAPPVGPGTLPPRHRPGGVTVAAVLTVTGSLIGLLGGGIMLLATTVFRDDYLEAASTGPFADWFSPAELESALGVFTVVFGWVVLLSILGLAAGLGLLSRGPVPRRRRARRLALLAAWLTVPTGVLTLPLGLVATGAAVVAIVALGRPESRAWASG